MSLSKRDFMQVLGAASVAGMGLGRWAEADAATAQAGLYELPRFGNVSFLHMTDCHAQLKPIHFREPSVNLGIGSMQGQLPHLVGEHLLDAAPDEGDATDEGDVKPYAGLVKADLLKLIEDRNAGRSDESKVAPESEKNDDLIAALVADDARSAAQA